MTDHSFGIVIDILCGLFLCVIWALGRAAGSV